MFAGWVNRHQLDVIAYLQEENRVLTERLGGRGIRYEVRSRPYVQECALFWRVDSCGVRIRKV